MALALIESNIDVDEELVTRLIEEDYRLYLHGVVAKDSRFYPNFVTHSSGADHIQILDPRFQKDLKLGNFAVSNNSAGKFSGLYTRYPAIRPFLVRAIANVHTQITIASGLELTEEEISFLQDKFGQAAADVQALMSLMGQCMADKSNDRFVELSKFSGRMADRIKNQVCGNQQYESLKQHLSQPAVTFADIIELAGKLSNPKYQNLPIQFQGGDVGALDLRTATLRHLAENSLPQVTPENYLVLKSIFERLVYQRSEGVVAVLEKFGQLSISPVPAQEEGAQIGLPGNLKREEFIGSGFKRVMLVGMTGMGKTTTAEAMVTGNATTARTRGTEPIRVLLNCQALQTEPTATDAREFQQAIATLLSALSAMGIYVILQIDDLQRLSHNHDGQPNRDFTQQLGDSLGPMVDTFQEAELNGTLVITSEAAIRISKAGASLWQDHRLPLAILPNSSHEYLSWLIASNNLDEAAMPVLKQLFEWLELINDVESRTRILRQLGLIEGTEQLVFNMTNIIEAVRQLTAQTQELNLDNLLDEIKLRAHKATVDQNTPAKEGASAQADAEDTQKAEATEDARDEGLAFESDQIAALTANLELIVENQKLNNQLQAMQAALAQQGADIEAHLHRIQELEKRLNSVYQKVLDLGRFVTRR